jgi:hypothetical protein
LVFSQAKPQGKALVEFIPFKRSAKREPGLKDTWFFQAKDVEKRQSRIYPADAGEEIRVLLFLI